MHVARLQPDPVHRREMTSRVAGVGMLHQLGLGGGTGGEIQQQRIGCQRHALCDVAGAGAGRLGVTVPAAGRGRPGADADRHPGPVPRDLGEPGGVAVLGDHVPDVAAGHPVGQVLRAEQGAGRDDDHAELHRGQDDLPQRRDVAQHQQQPVTPPGAEAAQPVGHLVGARGHLAVADPGGRVPVGHDAQRVAVRVLGRDHVEPVQGPVELIQLRPGELGQRGRVVRTVAQQKVPGVAEDLRGGGRVGHEAIVAVGPRRWNEAARKT